MTHFLRTLVRSLTGVLVVMAVATGAWSETKLTPSLGARTTYDDSTLGQGEADLELSLSPGIKYERASERTRLLLQGRVDAYRYADNDDYDRENAQAGATLSHAYSEKLTVRLGGQWVRDHTVESEYDESGIIAEKVARNSFSATPGLTLRLTERDDLALDGSGTLVRYEKSGYVDYDLAGLTTTWSRALGDGLWRYILQVGGQQVHFDRTDGETDQVILTALTGVSWRASEKLEFQAMGGVSQTSSEVTFDGGDGIDDTSLTFSGSLSATWTDEVWRLTLAADRSETPSTYGELITRDRLRATFGRNLTERLYLGVQGAWYISKTAGLVRDENTRTCNAGPTLRYRLTEDSTIEAGYSFIREDDMETDETTNRNRAYINYVVDFPIGDW